MAFVEVLSADYHQGMMADLEPKIARYGVAIGDGLPANTQACFVWRKDITKKDAGQAKAADICSKIREVLFRQVENNRGDSR